MTEADGRADGRVGSDGADLARAQLASGLQSSGRTPSPAVQAAFREVPRHLFVPELSTAVAYRDEALVIKYGDDGVPISSSSQPAMMAIMLEQLGLERGHRVLEIGTATGYNAAVMAHIVGPGGAVVTIDIDADLVARARASLADAGYSQVRASCGDGGYGDPREAPFDRVIVTAGAWDIAPAWLDQLGPGGRLVLPLAVRDIQLSVGLERDGDRWASTSAFRCEFVRMAGAFADPEPFRSLGASSGLYVHVDDGHPVDGPALASALAGPAVDVAAGIAAGSAGELADLDLWLTLTEPELDRLTLRSAPGDGPGSPLPLGALAGRDGEAAQPGVVGLAVLAEGDEPPDPPAVLVRGYGPGGGALAVRLAGRAAAWDSLGRPGAADLRLTVAPGGADLPPTAGRIILSRPHARLIAGWPAS